MNFFLGLCVGSMLFASYLEYDKIRIQEQKMTKLEQKVKSIETKLGLK